jgi:PqqD family protein of HPr-rel-A system
MQTSVQAEAEPCWSTPADEAFYWESWDDLHAVFASLSGDTHLLPDLTAHVLRMLDGHAGTASQLAEALCRDMEEPCDEHFVMNVTQLLQQLQAVGLVEKSAP